MRYASECAIQCAMLVCVLLICSFSHSSFLLTLHLCLVHVCHFDLQGLLLRAGRETPESCTGQCTVRCCSSQCPSPLLPLIVTHEHCCLGHIRTGTNVERLANGSIFGVLFFFSRPLPRQSLAATRFNALSLPRTHTHTPSLSLFTPPPQLYRCNICTAL